MKTNYYILCDSIEKIDIAFRQLVKKFDIDNPMSLHGFKEKIISKDFHSSFLEYESKHNTLEDIGIAIEFPESKFFMGNMIRFKKVHTSEKWFRLPLRNRKKLYKLIL